MVRNNVIEPDTAIEAANNQEYVKQNVGSVRTSSFNSGGRKI